MSETKTCRDCGREKSLKDDFYPCRYTLDGGQPYCKVCQRARSTASVMKQRNLKEGMGLPRTASRARVLAMCDDGYLARHLKRREEEAALASTFERVERESSPIHFQDAFCFDEPNRKPMFTGFVRKQTKQFSWRAA